MDRSSVEELYPDRETAQTAADYIDHAGGWQEPAPPAALAAFEVAEHGVPT